MAQTVTTLANGDKQIVITGSETWVFPADWNDLANKIEAYGRGGNGATGTATRSAGGGGSGAYMRVVNFPLKNYSVTNFDDAGNKKIVINAVNTSSQNYVFFTCAQNDESDPPVTIYLDGITGRGGTDASAIAVTAGSGGAAWTGASIPTLLAAHSYLGNNGASGGAGRSATTAAGGGCAGAAGPNGVGAAGGTNTTTNPTIGRGGGGGNGGTAGSGTSATGGTAGTGAGAGGTGGAASTSGSAGGAGTNVASTYVFSGGGGGGAGDGTGTTVGGAGGLYGAGGGGGASSVISTGGAGSIGALVITYTPAAAPVAAGNFFMLF